MDDSQRTYYADLQALAVEREALIRGALYNAGLPERDVSKLCAVCRELIAADGSMFPPSIEDLRIALGDSAATVERRLGVLVNQVRIVTVSRNGSSARYPKLRSINWERVRELARRPLPVEVSTSAPFPHAEGTKPPLPHGEGTRSLFEGTNEKPGSLFLDIYPPTPLEPKAEGAAVEILERSEAAEPQAVEPVATASASGPGWADVEAIVAACGVGGAAACCGFARRNGTAPAEVFRLVEAWKSQDGVGPGVLFGRIRDHVPGSAIGGVAAPEPVEFKLQRIAQRAEVGRAERERIVEETKRADDDRVRLASLEAEHGAAIDAASQGDLIAALEVTQRTAVVRLLMKPRGRDSPIVRAELLEAWATLHQVAGVRLEV